MKISLRRSKLIVRDIDASARFYTALGMEVVRRLPQTGTGGPVVDGRSLSKQEQIWVSETGDETSHVIILTRYLDFPPAPRPEYPGESWLLFRVADTDEAVSAVLANGGSIVIEPFDSPIHPVRACCVADPEGHHLELVGPKRGD